MYYVWGKGSCTWIKNLGLSVIITSGTQGSRIPTILLNTWRSLCLHAHSSSQIQITQIRRRILSSLHTPSLVYTLWSRMHVRSLSSFCIQSYLKVSFWRWKYHFGVESIILACAYRHLCLLASCGWIPETSSGVCMGAWVRVYMNVYGYVFICTCVCM